MESESGAPGVLFCDKNILVRLLTDDPPAQAQAAERALDAAAAGRFTLIITDVVFAELAYVLTEGYELSTEKAGARLGQILDLPGVEVADEQLLRDTLVIWKSGRLDFADAYLAALGRGTDNAGVLSFDRDYDRIPDLLRVDPLARFQLEE